MKKLLIISILMMGFTTHASTLILDCDLSNSSVYEVKFYRDGDKIMKTEVRKYGRQFTSEVPATEWSTEAIRLNTDDQLQETLLYKTDGHWFYNSSSPGFTVRGEAFCK